ncbi:cytochrome P450 [Fennellomyces sp. T-0311]|nr:cytochrome P450 [Fennellomyces sp. T-0311]
MDNQTLIREYLYLYRYYLALAATTVVCGRYIYKIITVPKKYRHLPVIGFWPYLRSLHKKDTVRARTEKFILPVLSKANGLYVNKLPLGLTIYVANPILAKIVLHKPEYAKKNTSLLDIFPPEAAIVYFAGKDNITIVNGEQWKEQRKIMNPAFHRAMPVEAFGSVMPNVFKLIESTQSKDELLSTIKLVKRITVDCLGKASFNFDFGAVENENSLWMKYYRQMFESFQEGIPSFYPRLDRIYRWISPAREERYQATFRLVELIDNLIEKRREELKKNPDLNDLSLKEKDLLTLMLEAQMRGEGSWSHQELRHNIATFFLAGQDTTSVALGFCFYHLARDKAIQKKAYEEVISVLGDEPVDVFPTLDHCKRLPYIDMLIKETLRMYPPTSEVTARITDKELNLGGYVIPKESMVNVDIVALHYRPDLWKNPDQFDPERFAEGGEHSRHEGITWAPFSGGSRQCIGINFALMQQRVIIAMLLKRYEFDLPTESIHKDNVVIDFPYNLVPENLEIKFNKRY